MSLRSRCEPGRPSRDADAHGLGKRPLFIHETRPEKPTSRRHSAVIKPTWKSLFAFTTGTQSFAVFSSTLLSIASGLVNPALAILLGRVFDKFSSFGAGTIDVTDLQDHVTSYSIILAGLGAASWALNTSFFAAWVAFGELQAKLAQRSVFTALATRPVTWYDLRKDGIAALVPRLAA